MDFFNINPTQHKNVAIYIRVSTLKQKEEGYGLDMQVDICKELCQYKRYSIYKIYNENNVSGTTKPTERPVMNQLITDAKSKLFNTVMCYSLDRLSRDNYNTLGFIRLMKSLDIEIISCKEDIDTSTYQGNFKVGLISLISELELNMIKHRLQMGIHMKAEIDGDIGGSLPYSYHRSENGIVINPYEERIVKYIFQQHQKGYSMGKIANALNNCEIPTPKKGKKWYRSTIKTIIDNKDKYSGGLVGENINNVRWPNLLTP